jgi:hypothetical protein
LDTALYILAFVLETIELLWTYTVVRYVFWIIVVFVVLLVFAHWKEWADHREADRIRADLHNFDHVLPKIMGVCADRRFIAMRRLTDRLIAAGATPEVMRVLSDERIILTDKNGVPDDEQMRALCWCKVQDSVDYKSQHSSGIIDNELLNGWLRKTIPLRLERYQSWELVNRAVRMEAVVLASEHGIRSLAEIEKISTSIAVPKVPETWHYYQEYEPARRV